MNTQSNDTCCANDSNNHRPPKPSVIWVPNVNPAHYSRILHARSHLPTYILPFSDRVVKNVQFFTKCRRFFFPFALLCRVGSIMYLVFIQWYYRQSFSEHPTSGTGTDQSFLTLIGPYKFGKADLRNEYLTFAGNGLRSRATYHTTSVSWLSHYMRRGSFNSKLLQKQFRGRLKKFWHQQYSNMNS